LKNALISTQRLVSTERNRSAKPLSESSSHTMSSETLQHAGPIRPWWRQR